MTGTYSSRILTGFSLAVLCAAAAAPVAATDADYGYGFYRTVEGEALLTTLEDDAEALEIEPNYPVLVGDRLWVPAGARVEAVLPDKSVLRLGEETEVFFESLTGSADAADDATTILHLLEGEMQVVGESYVLSDDPVRIDTSNSRVFLQFPGTYRLTSDGRGWTEVVVRGGFAEINTERGSVVLRDGESAEIAGDDRPEVSIAAAGSWNRLERWGAELSNEALAGVENVDASLGYAAAPLERSGYWVSVTGRRAWRPSVRVGWRPYSDGWWVHTPSGLSWVAYEPWGWVTSHYGAWDYLPGYGWLWFPGASYSPAWVYWYWGPTHTAWVPTGYYTRFYGPRYGWDFHYGVYGWAGGYWDSWSH
ncbi:MAG: FecR family protein, partial [Acidobacteriota bacterium]|nr:FecR family protein [Acidobacteriota bacterium]